MNFLSVMPNQIGCKQSNGSASLKFKNSHSQTLLRYYESCRWLVFPTTIMTTINCTFYSTSVQYKSSTTIKQNIAQLTDSKKVIPQLIIITTTAATKKQNNNFFGMEQERGRLVRSDDRRLLWVGQPGRPKARPSSCLAVVGLCRLSPPPINVHFSVPSPPVHWEWGRFCLTRFPSPHHRSSTAVK